MKKTQSTLAVATLAITSIASYAFADNSDTAQVFYDLLSNPGSETHAAAFRAATADNWTSVGDYSGENKSREAFFGASGRFCQAFARSELGNPISS